MTVRKCYPMVTESLSRSNLADAAYRHIYRKLWRGDFTIGSKLPEVALGQEIGVSRTPVREAIAQLEREGFVVQIPNTGCFIRIMERDELEELFDFRTHLECYALELVIRNEPAGLSKHLRHVCDRMFKLMRRSLPAEGRDAADQYAHFRSNWHLLDAEFHELILQSAGNRWISRVSGQLHLMSRIFMPGHKGKTGLFTIEKAIRIWRDHRQIIQAIDRHDLALGHRVLRRHIEIGRQDALKFLDAVDAYASASAAERKSQPAELTTIFANIVRLRELTRTS